ncbi:MAG: ATP-NAD kinase family protein, partial [Chloroflexota bacterium]|nr:ATP-NAD kinase family protein [Chloroflexota bacterium]
MPDVAVDAAAPRLGLIVNPIAGLGGRVGLKGTDGEGVAARALELGAQPRAMARTAAALSRLATAWPVERTRPTLLCGASDLGESAAEAAGWECSVVGGDTPPETTADDTQRVAAALVEAGIDVLLFAGGDGTARDISEAVGETIPVLGIPAGVKIQSAVFATSPGAAGEVTAHFLAGSTRRTIEREVLDLDEEAYRKGHVRPRLHGLMRVPEGRLLQSRKAPTPASDGATMESIAAEVESLLKPGRRYILGPGTTTRAVAQRLGIDNTLVGVDVALADTDGAHLEVRDAAEADLLALTTKGPSSIVVTPIGGQGFLFGRGNQPISPDVIRTVGLDHIVVVAT